MSDREADRRKRRSEALRENLKRRKSQLRGRAAAPPTGSDAGDPAATPDESLTGHDRQRNTDPIKTP